MPGSQKPSIEELVMSSARMYLYGHARAWDVRGGAHRAVAPPVARGGWRARLRLERRRPAGRPAAFGVGACG